MTEAKSGSKRRLVELDALRGIAAALVMLFHFTTRYEQLYGHETPPFFSLPWGHYGVNLFFMISGFVIFMTLHRIRRPLDFVVSRFSRLFPAYWIAVVVTFLLTYAFSLPGKMVSAGTAAMNLFMIHGLFRIPHVNGVYWTLEIEIIFYCMALLLYVFGKLDKVHIPLALLVALRMTYFLAEKLAGIEMSWTLSHLLILPYIAWFVCGIMIYRMVTTPGETPRQDAMLLIAAIVQLAIVEGLGVGLLATCLSAVLWLAAKGKLPFLANAVFAWLGAISYTLYLLHENIGWGVILHIENAGYSANLAIALAIATSLVLATGLTWSVERPAMNWLRGLYRRNAVPPLNMVRSVAFTGAVLLTVAGCALAWYKTHPLPRNPGDLVAQTFEPSPTTAVDCPLTTQPKPIMLFVLGQSNAGNHGESLPANAAATPATYFHDGRCYETVGPAPGATGQGSNPWVILAPELARAIGRPIVFSVLAVEGTEILNWTEPGRLHDRLTETIDTQRKHGFIPDLVLWQQGEADAKAGTTRAKYIERFGGLVSTLREHGISAPIVVALSTVCGNKGSESVRNAFKAIVKTDPGIKLGPDTDTLALTMRLNECHLNAVGQRAAAQMWLASLAEIGR
ncbi:MAG: acyltransferase family protein [Propionivibrio sp.]